MVSQTPLQQPQHHQHQISSEWLCWVGPNWILSSVGAGGWEEGSSLGQGCSELGQELQSALGACLKSPGGCGASSCRWQLGSGYPRGCSVTSRMLLRPLSKEASFWRLCFLFLKQTTGSVTNRMLQSLSCCSWGGTPPPRPAPAAKTSSGGSRHRACGWHMLRSRSRALLGHH